MLLKKILTQMVTDSTLDGCPHKRVLGGGLKVGVKVKGGELWLQLSRYRGYPSEVEWKTTVNALDGPKDTKPRAQFAEKGEYFLAGRWVLPEPFPAVTVASGDAGPEAA